MTIARPTAASAAEIAMEKIAIITPVDGCGGGAKRQNAMKFKFAAASIISIPIRMKIACRRLNAASSPMENRAADTMRKAWSVGVMAWPKLQKLKSYIVKKEKLQLCRRNFVTL